MRYQLISMLSKHLIPFHFLSVQRWVIMKDSIPCHDGWIYPSVDRGSLMIPFKKPQLKDGCFYHWMSITEVGMLLNLNLYPKISRYKIELNCNEFDKQTIWQYKFKTARVSLLSCFRNITLDQRNILEPESWHVSEDHEYMIHQTPKSSFKSGFDSIR